MLIRVLLAVETRSLDRDVRVALQGEDMVIESVIPDLERLKKDANDA